MGVSEEKQYTVLLEHILGDLAHEINETVGKSSRTDPKNSSACSIFLYDKRLDAYILRASTIHIPYLGKAEIDRSEDLVKNYYKKKNHVGLTLTALLSKDDVKSDGDCILKDKRHRNKENIHSLELRYRYCEFKNSDIRSLLVSPIYSKDEKGEKKVLGIVRVVRSKKIDNPFSDREKNKLRKLVDKKQRYILNSVFLSDLIELGSHTDLLSLCKQTAKVFTNILSAKGCSIFLLDEDASNENELIYKCYGTTGLVRINDNQRYQIDNPLTDEHAWYVFKPNENKPPIYDKNKPAMPLTLGVIRARISVFINDIYNPNRIEPFPLGYEIVRPIGHGKVSEDFVYKGNYQKSRSLLFAPIFYHDPNDEKIAVLGVVRVTSHKENAFSPQQQHLFVSMVESLSKAITYSKLVEFIDKVSEEADSKQLFRFIIANIPKFVGAKDCALLLKNKNKLKYAAEWRDLGGKKDKDMVRIEPSDREDYNLSDPHKRGYTGFVAITGRSLLYNNPNELPQVIKEMGLNVTEIPKHNEISGEDPSRYLGVPIINPLNGEVLGVLRICKPQNSSCITEEDRHVLTLISRRIQPHISQIIQKEREQVEIKKNKDRYFPSSLQIQLKKLDKLSYLASDELDKFFSKIGMDTNIEMVISQFIPKIWKYYDSSDNNVCDILNDFGVFNNKILTYIPYYRDHYIHQFIVYLLGVTIISAMGKEFETVYKHSYPDTKKLLPKGLSKVRLNSEYRKRIERAWMITAFFHDVGYPLETVNEWLTGIFEVFLRGPSQKQKKILNIESLLFATEYINRIDWLADFHAKFIDFDDASLIREVIIKTLQEEEKTDHGIMGALLLLSYGTLRKEEILPCASAIALHNKLFDNSNMKNVTLEGHPLAFILSYCDLLHEWERSEQKKNQQIKLTEFLLMVSKDDLINRGIDRKDLPDDNKVKWIFSRLECNEDKFCKSEEIRRKFMRLKSENVYFGIQINNEFHSSWPRKK